LRNEIFENIRLTPRRNKIMTTFSQFMIMHGLSRKYTR